MLDQAPLERRAAAREAEGGEDDEGHRRQDRQRQPQRSKRKADESSNKIARPDHQRVVAGLRQDGNGPDWRTQERCNNPTHLQPLQQQLLAERMKLRWLVIF